jgi:hypothetical protein
LKGEDAVDVDLEEIISDGCLVDFVDCQMVAVKDEAECELALVFGEKEKEQLVDIVGHCEN